MGFLGGGAPGVWESQDRAHCMLPQPWMGCQVPQALRIRVFPRLCLTGGEERRQGGVARAGHRGNRCAGMLAAHRLPSSRLLDLITEAPQST